MIVHQSSPHRQDKHVRRDTAKKQIEASLREEIDDLEAFEIEMAYDDYRRGCLRHSEVAAYVAGRMNDIDLLEAEDHMRGCTVCASHVDAVLRQDHEDHLRDEQILEEESDRTWEYLGDDLDWACGP